MDGETLVRRLVNQGLGSRRQCAALVVEGRVRVNGVVAEAITQRVVPRDVVEVEGRRLRAAPPSLVYVALHKPSGYLSAVKDARGRPTVLGLVPAGLRAPGLAPAGRLDLHTSGLMLLSNHGDFTLAVTHPRYGVEKEYEAAADAPLSSAGLRALRAGAPLPEGFARPKSVRSVGGARYRVVLTEGQKHEVRLLFESVGRRVTALKRVRVGSVSLGGLAPGRTRELTREEVAALLAPLRGKPPDSHGRTGKRGVAKRR
ncbi:MAG: pseudouridine synthase [Chloroflexota bacterium]|nr:pseudouridine synthase [Chloroflexota bacterium]